MFYLNKKPIIFYEFPNKEIYFKLPLECRQANMIDWFYKDSSDLIKLMFLKKHLDDDFRITSLRIRYLPYSRMDRKNQNYPFTLKYVCEFINSLNFFAVMIQDPHSDVAPALLNNCTAYSWVVPTAKKLIKKYNIDTVFYPDAGAQKRFDIKDETINQAYGFKTRNFEDGKITKYNIFGKVYGNVLIIDDICSRGGTFINAIKHMSKMELEGYIKKNTCGLPICEQSKPIETIFLIVSYLEENVYNGNLGEHVLKIFCNNPTIEVKDKYKEIIKIIEGE